MSDTKEIKFEDIDEPVVLTHSNSLHGVIYFRTKEIYETSKFKEVSVSFSEELDEKGYLLFYVYHYNDENPIYLYNYDYSDDEYPDIPFSYDNTVLNVPLLHFANILPDYLVGVGEFNDIFSGVLYTVDYFKSHLPFEVLSWLKFGDYVGDRYAIYRFIFRLYEPRIKEGIFKLTHEFFISDIVDYRNVPAYREYIYAIDKYVPYLFCWAMGLNTKFDLFENFIEDITIAIIDYQVEGTASVRPYPTDKDRRTGLIKIFKNAEKYIVFNEFDKLPKLKLIEESTMIKLLLGMTKDIETYGNIDSFSSLLFDIMRGSGVRSLNYRRGIMVVYDLKKLFDEESYTSFEIEVESSTLKVLTPYIKYMMAHALLAIGGFAKVGTIDISNIEVSFSSDGTITGIYKEE